MKGQVVAVIWTIIILVILSITYPIWSFAITELTTQAGGDQFTVLLANAIFIIIVLGCVGAIWMFRNRPEESYVW